MAQCFALKRYKNYLKLGKKFIGVTTGTQDLRQARITRNRFTIDVDNTIQIHLPNLRCIASNAREPSNALVQATTHISPTLQMYDTNLEGTPSDHTNTPAASQISSRDDYLAEYSNRVAKYRDMFAAQRYLDFINRDNCLTSEHMG